MSRHVMSKEEARLVRRAVEKTMALVKAGKLKTIPFETVRKKYMPSR